MTSKWKRKGKPKYLSLESYMVKSDAWRSLMPNDRALYLELKWRFDGFNNGRIGLGVREAADALNIGKNACWASFRTLQEKGFIRVAKASGFNIKSRRSTEWRLTEIKSDINGDLPTMEFMKWRPDEKSTVPPQGHTVPPQGRRQEHIPKNAAHSPLTGTVERKNAISQSPHKDTYTGTIGDAPTAPPASGDHASDDDRREANQKATNGGRRLVGSTESLDPKKKFRSRRAEKRKRADDEPTAHHHPPSYRGIICGSAPGAHVLAAKAEERGRLLVAIFDRDQLIYVLAVDSADDVLVMPGERVEVADNPHYGWLQ